MNTFYQDIRLDMYTPHKQPIVYAKQGDSARTVRAELCSNDDYWTAPEDVSCLFGVAKPDGTYYETSVNYSVTEAGRTFVFCDLGQQAVAAIGRAKADIKFIDAGEVLSTFCFEISVMPQAVPDDAIVSDDYFDMFLDEVQEYIRVKGAPLVSSTVAGMTDHNKVYVYTGTETGYTAGNWYYWDGSAWTSGGVYNSQALSDEFLQAAAQAIKQTAVASESDSVPYLYRPTPNPSAILADEEIVGGTIAFNQLCNSASVTVPNGHKYYLLKAGASTITASTGAAVTGLTNGVDMVIDLTAMLGSTIADYLNTLESGTAGAGVAKLREWGFLSKEYYAYDAGSLVSVNTEGKEVVGFNLLQTTLTNITTSGVTYTVNDDGTILLQGTATAGVEKTIGTLTCEEGKTYHITGSPYPSTSCRLQIKKGSASSAAIQNQYNNNDRSFIASGTDTYYLTLYITNATNVNGIIIKPMVNVGTPATSFVPYRKTTYPTTPTDLNGIFKLDANNQLYADGDRYKSDGTITRKWGIVDLGTLSWTLNNSQFYSNQIDNTQASGWNYNVFCARYEQNTSDHSVNPNPHIRGINAKRLYIIDDNYADAASFKTAMNGVYCIYELATPTTDTADTYPATQIAPKGGTERRIDNRSVPVPVGHRTTYSIGVPDVPASGSNMTLKATVANGKTTLSWS